MSPIKTTQRQECQIFSRVTGYLTPVSQWNDAKVAEFNQRKTFVIKNSPDGQ